MPGTQLMAFPDGEHWRFWHFTLDGETAERSRVHAFTTKRYVDRYVAQYLLRLSLSDLDRQMTIFKTFVEERGADLDDLPQGARSAYDDAFAMALLVAATIDRHF
jgi:hypothetical protein